MPKAKAINMNPTESKTIPVQRSVFDLDTMTDVTLFKEVEFTPAMTTEEALKRVGNDAKKFLSIINEGLESETRRSAVNDPSIPWLQENDEGEKSAFAGTPADSKAVNGLVLNLAKSVFGYTKEASPETKKAAKQSAMDMITSNDAIREGLKKNAAA
jgi:hypothetical protein